MRSIVAAILFLSMALPSSAIALFVGQQPKGSVVDLNMFQQNSSNVTFPSSSSSDLSNIIRSRRSEVAPLVEQALELIFHELYDSPSKLSSTPSPPSSWRNFFNSRLASLSEYLMSLMENSLEDLPSLTSLKASECMKRIICEAHNQPKKYGLMALVIQVLFPPYTNMEDPNHVASEYELAARFGRQINANCGVQYYVCIINVLDIILALVNEFNR